MNSPNYLVWMRVKYELTTKGLVSRGSDPDPVNVQPDPQLCWASMNSPNYLVWMRVKEDTGADGMNHYLWIGWITISNR